MRSFVLLSLLAWLAAVTPAEARLFWQTYGSIVPAKGSPGSCGAGCTWNANQDYFITRYCTTGRYELFSSCKKSHTISPACKRCHPLYPGYCTIYGPFHYCWRNHTYGVHCGCSPICNYRHSGKCCRCGRGGCGSPAMSGCPEGPPLCTGEASYWMMLSLEDSGFEVLGSIPADGSELLASVGLTNLDSATGALALIVPARINPQDLLPALGLP